jgi:outer membrane protein OmpA-like peptidoglycan-associated protein/tetratricopeptide (TPR) repeat protein
MLKKILLLAGLFFSTICLGQAEMHEANDYFMLRKYRIAVPVYQKAYLKKPTYTAASRLAECYWRLKMMGEAEIWYEKALKYPEFDPEIRLQYADVLKQKSQYYKAKDQYQEYSTEKGELDSLYLISLQNYCDSFALWSPVGNHYYVAKVEGINTPYSEISPFLVGNRIGFTSDRIEGNSSWKLLNQETGNAYYEMYLADYTKGLFSKIQTLSDTTHNPYHEGPGCHDDSSKTFVYTATLYDKKKRESYFSLDLYIAKFDSTQWTNPKPFPHNTNEYNEGHPFITDHGKTLYFVSNKPGGYGGTDIYVSYKTDTSWSRPSNLGPTINTAFDEKFPCQLSTGELFYCSNQPSSMGGLDIYRSTLELGLWSKGENLKPPMNSSRDDLGIMFFPEYKTGLFSSNRGGGLGFDDIYRFERIDRDQNEIVDRLAIAAIDSIFENAGVTRTLMIEGLSFNTDIDSSDFITGRVLEILRDSLRRPVAGTEVKLINQESGNQFNSITNSNGEFTIERDLDNTFSILASKEGYFTTGNNVKVDGKSNELSVFGKSDILENIEYDFDDYRLQQESFPILDRVVNFLAQNPSSALVIRSYTDSQGKESYNLRLSEKRAASVRKYLIEKGIASSRLYSIGFGEANLIIKNAKTDAEHQINRRTEFDVQRKK